MSIPPLVLAADGVRCIMRDQSELDDVLAGGTLPIRVVSATSRASFGDFAIPRADAPMVKLAAAPASCGLDGVVALGCPANLTRRLPLLPC